MNKRIRELAEHCDFYVGNEHYNESHEEKQRLWTEKFAELIVRECMQQCEQVRDDAAAQKKSEFLTESGKTLYEGVYGGATNCGFAIQQHFGVEE